VLPELSTIEYSRSAFELLGGSYKDISHNAAGVYQQLSEQYGCAVCYGFARRDGENVHISQAVIRPNDAEMLVYDKIHLAHLGGCTEKDFFQPGDDLCVFELSGFRIAIVICYDFRFSALIYRLSKEHGIDLFLHPVAFSRDSTFPSRHPFVIARAIEHQTYFESESDHGYWGKSVFCPPWLDSQYQLRTFFQRSVRYSESVPSEK
jgi:nitrilase